MLRSLYFLHFFALGTFMPYLPIHFRDLGMTNAQIGVLASVLPLFITLAPAFWTQAADRSGTKKHFVVLASAGSALAFLFLARLHPFGLVLLGLSIFCFFRSPTGSLLESITFEHLKLRGGDYGRIRMFGSFGFILSVLVIGQLFERWGTPVLSTSMLLSGLGAAACAALLPASPQLQSSAGGRSLGRLLGNRTYVIYLATAFLMRLSHAGYVTFYSIYLDSLGVSRGIIGVAWSLGVICEVAVLMTSGRIVRRAGVQALILLAMGAAVLRWFLFATATNPGVLVAAQSLHGLTFGAFHVGSVTLIQSLVPDELRASGQGLFTASAYGLGGILGAWMVGAIAAAASIPVVFGTSVGIVLLALLVFIITVLPRLKDVALFGAGERV
ncbi:MAG: MFS transporter [Candidatus Tectomicrobia bacterium]|nr:MFS transporter [Candidatus Tectomicrobia bacterium]